MAMKRERQRGEESRARLQTLDREGIFFIFSSGELEHENRFNRTRKKETWERQQRCRSRVGLGFFFSGPRNSEKKQNTLWAYWADNKR